MTRTCRLDLIDASRPGLFSRLRRCGRWLGRGVLIVLAGLAVWQVRGLFRELDALREAKAVVMEQAPALTAAITPSGERLVWGPPMTVVIRGELWTVRAVMEEGR